MTWTEYHPVEDMHAFLDYLETTYPDLVSTESIGSSGEGRDMRIAKVSPTENPQHFKMNERDRSMRLVFKIIPLYIG
jgi:hypothetical protein